MKYKNRYFGSDIRFTFILYSLLIIFTAFFFANKSFSSTIFLSLIIGSCSLLTLLFVISSFSKYDIYIDYFHLMGSTIATVTIVCAVYVHAHMQFVS